MTPAKQAARYKKALENILAYVPYAYAQELAANALDLKAELMNVPEQVALGIETKPEEEENNGSN